MQYTDKCLPWQPTVRRGECKVIGSLQVLSLLLAQVAYMNNFLLFCAVVLTSKSIVYFNSVLKLSRDCKYAISRKLKYTFLVNRRIRLENKCLLSAIKHIIKACHFFIRCFKGIHFID